MKPMSAPDHTNLPSSQDDDVVLVVEDISKKFCRSLKHSLFYGLQDISTELTGARKRKSHLRSKEFWALQNVSFQLRKGESLGLIGANGSGKTTLLRIISGLIKPDQGLVKIQGRVAPLIALGAGFNPILTGRENIYANMSILGLSQQEIEERFDDVVEFAEVGEAIDAPVQTYSSGMAARLGFATAIHTEPDILLIDEVLAVGDLRFRQKCNRRLSKLRNQGTSFILVSHNSQVILSVCQSSIYLSKGKVIKTGNTESVMHHYEKDLFIGNVDESPDKIFFPKKQKKESLGLDIKALFFRDQQEEIIDYPVSGKPTYFCIQYHSLNHYQNAGVNLMIQQVMGENELLLVLNSFNDEELLKLRPGEHEIRLWMPYFCLRTGVYTMRVVVKSDPLFTLDLLDGFKFTVKGKESIGRSLFYQPRVWKV